MVKPAIKNNFTSKVESARAVCFLLNEQGQMVGQSAKWVINENLDKTELARGTANQFNFVITSPQPWATTNLTAKVSFNRVVLSNGKTADVQRDVTVNAAIK